MLPVNDQHSARNNQLQNPRHPLWMDIFREGDIRAFKIGVEFMGNADNKEMLHLEQVVSKR